MAVQQPVAVERIRDIIEISALRSAPVALTCRVHDTWRSFRSRFLGMRGGQVWIEYPERVEGQTPPELLVGRKVGLAFKQRHHKFVFSSAVRETANFKLNAKTTVHGVSIAWPASMQQMQRRMFHRVDVPHDRQVFVEFWEGGLDQEPRTELREKLIYHGQLVDLSIGGFQVRLLGEIDPRFQDGAPIGTALRVHEDQAPIKTDCQFRHANADEFGITLGMQIVGLNETAAGRQTLERLGKLIRGFQQAGTVVIEPVNVKLGC